MNLSPLLISIKTSLLATLITVVLGILVAFLVYNLKKGKGIIDVIMTLPMVLPPTVIGFLILIVLGKNSWLGQLLTSININVIFSWSATVIASTIVSLPLMYRTTLAAFEGLDQNLVYASKTLGLSQFEILFKILIPNCKYGIMAGVILSFTRALGEFGATMMVAGNIPGKTQTIAVAIYSAVQAGHHQLAYQYMGMILIISTIMMGLLNYFTHHKGRH